MTTRADSTEPADSAPATLDESLVGQRIHKYEIIRVIGRGGMGTVYEALNTDIGKRVAMKFVDVEMSRNKDAVARFQREAQAASAVESAHIVEIFDSGTTEAGQPFIVMEVLRGEDLGHRIKRCGRLELGEAGHIVAQILRGLHRAHAAGIVHRDLKPDNIFLVDRDDDTNFAKILDFGISKVQRTGDVPVNTLTRQGTVLGTPFYMSPEQAQALADIDGRTDLWSVGAILYECLTGRPPYGGTTYEQVIINICMKDADDVRLHNPAVPEAVAQMIARALTRDRDARFSNAREFLDALVSSSGGLVSSRPGRTSGDDLSGSLTPSGSVPSSAPATSPQPSSGFAPTVEVHPAGTSKVGWSTNRRQTSAQNRRRFLVVGAIALAFGAIVGVLWKRGVGLTPPAAAPSASSVASRELSISLRSNLPHPRFLVGGEVVPGGVIKGMPGELRHVRVEAEGATPFEADVRLTEGAETMTLDAPAITSPQVSPVGDASAAASAAPAETGKHVVGVPKPPPSGRHSEGAKHPPTGGPPTQTAPRPPSTGIGAGLQLKPD